MKEEGKIQALRANIYYYCSALKRERAVSLLLSDKKKREKGLFPFDLGIKFKNQGKMMLSADLITSKLSLHFFAFWCTQRKETII